MFVLSRLLFAALLMMPLLGFAAISPSQITFSGPTDDKPTPFNSSVDEAMKSFGYQGFEMDGSAKSGTYLKWLNRIYLEKDKSATSHIFVKSGVKMGPEAELGKIYSLDPTTYATAIPDGSGKAYLIFFDKVRLATVESMGRSISKALGHKYTRFYFLNRILLPRAHAESKDYYCSGEVPPNAIFSAALRTLKLVGPCFHDIGMGAWESTGGFLKSMYDAAWNLGETWDKIKNEWKAFGNLVGGVWENFLGSMGEFKELILGLPLETSAKIICELIGNAGGAAAITMLSAGLGGATVPTLIANTLTKVSKMTELAGSKSLVMVAKEMEYRAARSRLGHKAADLRGIDSGLTTDQKIMLVKTTGVVTCNDIATLRGTRGGYGETLLPLGEKAAPAPAAK